MLRYIFSKRRVCRVMALSLMCLCVPVGFAAAKGTGAITGTIKDAQTGALPGVSLTLRNLERCRAHHHQGRGWHVPLRRPAAGPVWIDRRTAGAHSIGVGLNCQSFNLTDAELEDLSAHLARGFGRSWNFTAFGGVSGPPSLCQPA